MAYKPILQAALEYKPRGFLTGTYAINLRQGLGYLTCRISSTAKYHQRQQQGRAAAYPLHVS